MNQSRALLVTVAAVVSFVITQQTQAIPESTGPGVAGMVHALAYDPEVPGRIYAGGDVCGVYQSNDNGISWHLIDRGLESSDLTSSFYVDDLIVIGEPDSGAPVHSQRLGVYAATHGGVYFRPQGSQFWQLMTDYNANPAYWFGADPGVAIPFSCFGYDRRNGILYAGTGHGRRDNADGSAWRPYYPEATPQTVEQYSIWKLDLKVAGSIWVPITSTDRKGIVRQIAISDVNNDTDEDVDVTYVSFSSRSGLYSFVDGDPTCTNLLDFDKSEPSGVSWSGKAWGVAAGSNNILYALLTEALPDVIPTVNRPAVWYFDLAESDPTRQFLDPNATVLPHGGTWVDFIAAHLEFEIFSLTVIPGESGAFDEVYIGTGGTVYGGLWRYGDFINNGVPSRGWIATILFDLPAVWDEFEYNYINYLNDPITTTPFEPGWLDNYALHATTPLVYHPLDHDEKFHMAYAIPMAMDADLPGVWSPRNCQGSGDFWASNGLNLMCPRDCSFLSDGRLVIGALDFAAFVSADASCESFRWISRPNIGSLDVDDTEISEDEIYFVRTGPRRVFQSPGNWGFFGYQTYLANPNDSASRITRQRSVIAKYSEPMCAVQPTPANADGYCLEFISRGLDDLFPDSKIGGSDYNVSCMTFVNPNTIFAAVTYKNAIDMSPCATICKGTKVNGEWSWQKWYEGNSVFNPNPVEDITDILYLPDTRKVIALYFKGDTNKGGVVAIDVDTPDSAEPWLTAGQDFRARQIVRHCVDLACDKNGEYLYVGSQGARRHSDSANWYGGILRLKVPSSGTPAVGDWVVILNEGDQPFTSFAKPYGYDNSNWGAGEEGFRLTGVESFAIDPVNPLHIYAGIGCGTYLHPNNGVWEYTPPAEVGGTWTWNRIMGDPFDEPTFTPVTMGISPVNPSLLIVGTAATEFYRVSIAPSSVPTVLSEEPLHADQTFLKVTGAAANGSDPLASVVVDGTPLGLGAEFVLNDVGTAPDVVAGDGIWTVDLGSITVEPGVYALPVVARDGLGYTLRGTLSVSVVELPVWLKEDSAATGELYDYKSGHPYSANFFDSGRHGKLLVITAEYDNDGDGGQVFRNNLVVAGVPEFVDREVAFAMPLNPSHRAIATGDYDRDGYVDFFVGSAVAGESRLYHNVPEGFADARSMAFPYPQALDLYDVLNASWIDFNQDGWLDLSYTAIDLTPAGGTATYIEDLVPTTGLSLERSSYLLRNDLGQQFMPIWPLPMSWSFGHVWVDLDNDGDRDFVVADMVGYQNLVLINNNAEGGSYGLTDQTSQWLAGNLPLPGKVVTTLDYDRDGLMDLAYATWDGEYSDVILLRNTGSNLVVDPQANAALTKLPWQEFLCSGIVAEDIDLNGWDDIVVLPEGDSSPRIFFNRGPAGDWFQDVQSLVPASGSLSGAAVADYNGDGDADFYFGSDEGQPFFYRNVPTGYDEQTPEPSPENNWIKVDLRSYPYSGAMESVIGARVRIVYGAEERQTKIVDGGQGRTGQKPPILTFGLGAVAQVDTIRIMWPDGVRETLTGPFSEGTTVVHQRASMAVVSGSPQFTYVAYPGGADWIFSWRTNYHSDRRFDRVAVEYSDCGTSETLSIETPGILYKQYRLGNEYVHSMRWNGKCCVPHTPTIYRFRVYSGYAAPQAGSEYTSWKMFGPKVCPQQQ